MAEESKYITKKKKTKPGPQAGAEEGRKRKSNMIVLTEDNYNKMLGNPEIGKDIIILAPDNNNKINYRRQKNWKFKRYRARFKESSFNAL